MVIAMDEKDKDFEEFVKKNPDEAVRIIVKAFKEKELLKIGNRSYVDAFRYPESYFDIKELMPDGGSLQVLNNDMLQPLRDPTRVFSDQIVIPPGYLIWASGTNYYAKNGLTGDVFSDKDIGNVANSALNNLPKVTNPQSSRLVPNGKVFIKTGVYHGTQTIFLYDDWFVEIEGEMANQLTNQSPNFSGAPDTLVGGTIINIESQYGAICLKPYPGGENTNPRADLISLKNLNFYMKNNNIVDPYNYAIVSLGPWAPFLNTTPAGNSTIQPRITMGFLEGISIQDYGGRNPLLHFVAPSGYDEIMHADKISCFGYIIPYDAVNCPNGAPTISLYGSNAHYGYFSLTINGINDANLLSHGAWAYGLYIVMSGFSKMDELHYFGNPNGFWRIDGLSGGGTTTPKFMFGELHMENTLPPNNIWSYYTPFSGNPVIIEKYESTNPNFNPISKYGRSGIVYNELHPFSEILSCRMGNAQYGMPDPTIPTNPPASGTDYQNTNYMDIVIYIPITLNPTSSASASASISVGRSTSSYVTQDTVTLPAGAVAGQIYTLKAVVPAGFYFNVSVSNATIGTATVHKLGRNSQ
jgi:hypothetical protein